MFNDLIKPKGNLEVILIDGSTGKIKQKTLHKNIVVTVGKEYIASRMASNDDDIMDSMSIGNSNSNLSTSNTSLASELASATLTSTTVTSNVVTYSCTFNAGVGTGAIVEAGIFNSSSPEIMLCRTTFPVVNKAAGDVLTINWNVTIS